MEAAAFVRGGAEAARASNGAATAWPSSRASPIVWRCLLMCMSSIPACVRGAASHEVHPSMASQEPADDKGPCAMICLRAPPECWHVCCFRAAVPGGYVSGESAPCPASMCHKAVAFPGLPCRRAACCTPRALSQTWSRVTSGGGAASLRAVAGRIAGTAVRRCAAFVGPWRPSLPCDPRRTVTRTRGRPRGRALHLNARAQLDHARRR
jgi:hypothetical protein